IVTTGIEAGSALPAPFLAFFPIYASYMLLEFGAICLALVFANRAAVEPMLLTIAILLLLILPWFHFGPNNDLVTRGSIPALTVILLMIVDGWAQPARLGGRAIFITIFLLIGAVLPIARMAQAPVMPAWKPDLQHSVYEVASGNSPAYLALLHR